MALASYTQFKAGLIMGGENFQKQMVMLRKNPEIIIATPGRMKQHLEQNTPHFNELEVLILDEADRMLDMGFSADVLYITSQCNKDRQTLLFSATLNHKAVQNMAVQVLREPAIVTLNTVKDKHESIRQQVLLADDDRHKVALADWLLKNEQFEKALIFTKTKVATEALSNELRKHDHRTAALNGDMDQVQRNVVMGRIHQGIIRVLVATDVAARGLDVPGIDLVINFDMARNGRDYVHRIGRTGRAGRQGLAISLIAHNEWNLLAGIERYLEQKFERRKIKTLEGTYQGPKKVKASGKAAGPKKNKANSKAGDKAKQRQRNRSQIGKRRKPSRQADTAGSRPGPVTET
jgi:superfamily II DNA/RNA helicase